MKFKFIIGTTFVITSALLSSTFVRSLQAQNLPSGSAIDNFRNGNNLPSDFNRIEQPRFVNPNPTEPLGSQQFFRDGLNTLDATPSPPPDNPLTINEENLVPTEIPSDKLMRDRQQPEQKERE